MISAIVFTRGCGFRCPYCHNPELVDPSRYTAAIPVGEITAFLRSRAGRIEGVVVTGGEPTIHADLPAFLRSLKSLGLKVKLDTNGSNPVLLRRVLSDRLVDFIAMDVKAPLAAYERVVRAAVDVASIRESIALVLGSGLPHEFRTTIGGPAPAGEDLPEIAKLVIGCRQLVLQAFRPGKTLEPLAHEQQGPGAAELRDLAAQLTEAGVPTSVR
jgi:pyruvate formate lyase activating enzyme